jgi:hypothetical protein
MSGELSLVEAIEFYKEASDAEARREMLKEAAADYIRAVESGDTEWKKKASANLAAMLTDAAIEKYAGIGSKIVGAGKTVGRKIVGAGKAVGRGARRVGEAAGVVAKKVKPKGMVRKAVKGSGGKKVMQRVPENWAAIEAARKRGAPTIKALKRGGRAVAEAGKRHGAAAGVGAGVGAGATYAATRGGSKKKAHIAALAQLLKG